MTIEEHDHDNFSPRQLERIREEIQSALEEEAKATEIAARNARNQARSK
jgi:uncharacterized protein YigA (DUF484 family)